MDDETEAWGAADRDGEARGAADGDGDPRTRPKEPLEALDRISKRLECKEEENSPALRATLDDLDN